MLLLNPVIVVVLVLRVHPPENKQLIQLLLVLDEVLPTNDRKVVLALGQRHAYDLVGLTRLGLEQLYFDLANLREIVQVKDEDLVNLGHEEDVDCLHLDGFRALEIFRIHFYFQVVHVFAGVHVERFLVELEGDGVADPASKDQLVAIHVVVHHVLQLGHVRLLVDQVKVDFILSNHLYSDVLFYIRDKTAKVQTMKFLPIELFGELIFCLFKK